MNLVTCPMVKSYWVVVDTVGRGHFVGNYNDCGNFIAENSKYLARFDSYSMHALVDAVVGNN